MQNRGGGDLGPTTQGFREGRFAFTLAEVLITLGIIGIVAALTMPVLIANYQKKNVVVNLEKAYTNLSQAIKLSEASNGELEYWDFGMPAKDFFNKYLYNFVSVNNSTFNSQDLQYKYLNGNNCTEILCTENSYIVFLSDGMLLIVSSANFLSDGRVISIDINGLKKPNIVGKDFFSFALTKNNGIVPFGAGNFGISDGEGGSQSFGTFDRDKLKGNNSYACNREKKGYWCAALIMFHNWTIKKDYPW